MTAVHSAFSSVMARMPGTATSKQTALVLAAAGVPVFPVAAESKRPLTRRGFHDASADPGQLRSWWSAHPRANLAIPTGKTSGVVVVDVDVHGQVNGYDALNRAHVAGLVAGWEMTVRSPSGGLHLYFHASSSDQQRSWQAARAGIDFRGDGGYIIVPPSARMIEGERTAYVIDRINSEQRFMLDAERLRDFLDPQPAIHRSDPAIDQPFAVERLAAWVARRQEGERNHGLFWAACKMAEHDVPAGSALEALTVAGGSAGLTDREISTTVRSAYRSVHGSQPSGARASSLPQPDRAPPCNSQSRVLA
ncbi:Phage replication protein |uniref:Phage replication protein \|nr:bifunctional DNA primase/polymerase [Microbacterium esteraromaticum]SJN44767.1 Phage replication protein \